MLNGDIHTNVPLMFQTLNACNYIPLVLVPKSPTESIGDFISNLLLHAEICGNKNEK